MFDIENRIRNSTGNYRYVSYLMRLWKLQAIVGIGREQLEKKLISQAVKNYSNLRPWTSVDLGCGGRPINPFLADEVHGCDLKENQATKVSACNLVIEPIPYASSSLDFVTAQNFIEHVPRVLVNDVTKFPFIALMAEIYRVLKPQGLFYSKTPAYPRNEAFQDPTHVNIITNETFPFYFCWHPFGGPWARLYGFEGKFELVTQRWQGPHLLSLLKKI
jgi:SAM-dependent methyltransferase